MNGYFLTATIFTCITLFIHCYFGGRYITPPLLESQDIKPRAKYIHYGNWHVATIMLTTMAVSFLWSTFQADVYELALVFTCMAALISVWALIINIVEWQEIKSVLPHSLLFLSIAVAGGMGV